MTFVIGVPPNSLKGYLRFSNRVFAALQQPRLHDSYLGDPTIPKLMQTSYFHGSKGKIDLRLLRWMLPSHLGPFHGLFASGGVTTGKGGREEEE